ncbi:MAG: hypothetical protein JSW71_23810 [Gemmatimonadota bacterium]|nr:MAG: hypothetical protein JSW71_23810 [Gemmatimonadota bacterium]
MRRVAAGARGTRGKTRLGCILTLLLLAIGLYYGIPIGTIYVNHWRFKEEMKTQARLAPSIDDAAIRRRLRLKAEDLGLPEEARQIVIRRTLRPREIVIRTTYEQTIDLPFVHHTFTLSPEVRSPL